MNQEDNVKGEDYPWKVESDIPGYRAFGTLLIPVIFVIVLLSAIMLTMGVYVAIKAPLKLFSEINILILNCILPILGLGLSFAAWRRMRRVKFTPSYHLRGESISPNKMGEPLEAGFTKPFEGIGSIQFSRRSILLELASSNFSFTIPYISNHSMSVNGRVLDIVLRGVRLRRLYFWQNSSRFRLVFDQVDGERLYRELYYHCPSVVSEWSDLLEKTFGSRSDIQVDFPIETKELSLDVRLRKRLKPTSNAEILIMICVVLVSILCIFGTMQGLFFSTELFIIALLIGPLLLILLLLELLSPRSERSVLRRSSRTATARVIESRSEKISGSQRKKYFVRIEFEAIHSDNLAERVVLEAKVKKRIFERLHDECKILYATENPLVALLEGEFRE